MSVYTAQISTICESLYGLSEPALFTDIQAVLKSVHGQVFNFTYPIFDETYRAPLEIKILRHFYTREIAHESVGMWKLKLCDRMNLIMPYYNQLYKSELIEFNPLYDTDLTRQYSRQNEENKNRNENSSGDSSANSNQTGTDNNTTTADNWNLFNATPQGGLDGVRSLNYLTEATNDQISQNVNSNSTNEANSNSNYNNQATTNENINNVEGYLEHVIGKNGGENYSDMLNKYRQTFLNIDARVIEELNDLFFGLW